MTLFVSFVDPLNPLVPTNISEVIEKDIVKDYINHSNVVLYDFRQSDYR